MVSHINECYNYAFAPTFTDLLVYTQKTIKVHTSKESKIHDRPSIFGWSIVLSDTKYDRCLSVCYEYDFLALVI